MLYLFVYLYHHLFSLDVERARRRLPISYAEHLDTYCISNNSYLIYCNNRHFQKMLKTQLDCLPVDFSNLFRFVDLDEDSLISLNQVAPLDSPSPRLTFFNIFWPYHSSYSFCSVPYSLLYSLPPPPSLPPPSLASSSWQCSTWTM